MLISTAGALFLVTGFETGLGFAEGRRLDRRLPRDGGCCVRDRDRGHDPRDRAGEIRRRRAPIMRAHAGESRLSACRRDRASAPSPNFSPRDMAVVVLAFVVLFKFCDALAGAMTAPFVIDLGFLAQRLCQRSSRASALPQR